MSRIEDISPKRRFFTIILCLIFMLSVFQFGMFNYDINVNAALVDHTNGNLDIKYLTDYGRILQSFNWGQAQTARDSGGFGFIGLVIDHDGYNHIPDTEDIADSFQYFPYGSSDDFKSISPISLVIDNGDTQKSRGSYQNQGAGTQDPFDITVDQTAWTKTNKDWAILQWTVTNIKSPSSPLTNVCIGLEIPFSKDGARFGVGGDMYDGGDDIDGFDSTNGVYWVRDTNSGITMGVGSAIPSDPITHYYGEDYHSDYTSEYRNFFSNDTWLYNRIHAPNATATNGITPGNVTTTIGWNSFDLNAGESRTFTMAIAINGTQNDMIYAINDARDYYYYEATGYLLTEIMDSESGAAQIEVFNYGREPTDISTILSLSANTGALSGSWNPTVIPTYGYSIFTPNENIGFEGDTIRLYESGLLIDTVSFGTNGIAPDPLKSESIARYYDPTSASYINSWTRNVSSGSTWGVQNDIPGVMANPDIVLNEVMFNPSVSDGGYIVLLNKNPVSAMDISGYTVVGDTEYRLSDNPGIWLDPGNSLIIGYPDDLPQTSNLFDNMNSVVDNVYLYDKDGKLLDMVGWNSPHQIGMSVRRNPLGSGTHEGYDDLSSLSAGWAFDSPLYVLITEFSDSQSATAQIEVYNPFYPKIDFSLGFSFDSATKGSLSGLWSTPVAQSNGYAVFDVTTSGGLGSTGDTIYLNQNSNLIDEISYGQVGVAPDPLSGESVQRVYDTGTYSEDWSRNTQSGPNFGSQNNVPAPNFNSTIKLNEILFNPTNPNQGFVELVLIFSSLDISGYKIVANKEYIVPPGTNLNADNSYFYLDFAKDPLFFSSLNPQGDNIYLYDDNGALLDIVGWSSLHTQGKSVCRIPDGNGTRDGYHDASSVLAGWRFDCIPTVQLVKVISDKTTVYGNFSEYSDFIMTIENMQSSDDTVAIFSSTLNGYSVIIMDETGTFEISDVFVLAGSSSIITIRVQLPNDVPFSEWDNISITIQSLSNSLYRDSTTVKAVVSPFIWPRKYPTPQDINIDGSGFDEISTITLNLTGMGSALEFKHPQEVIFCVDTSGSMTPQAIDMIKMGLVGYVDKMEKPDRGAVVVFNSGAWLMNSLSDNYTQLKNDINNIPGPGGSTLMGEALQIANSELSFNGNSSFIQVIILLTDGVWNGFVNPIDEANRAAVMNITIFTIGLEPDPSQNPLDEALLQQIADITGGQYFYAEDANQIPEIYMIIAAYIGNLAGRDVDVTDSVPMVRDVLPPWIVLVSGSFSITPETNYVDGTGYRILEWNISQISIGESWEVTFSVKSTKLGWVYANDVNNSRVYYVDYFNKDIFKLFPECMLNVSTPPPQPPLLYIDILSNNEDILLYWEKPTTPATDHYLIYQAQSPTGFDFSKPWIDTSSDLDPLDPGGIAVGLRLSWNHTGSADPGNSEYSEQWYYCMRTVNKLGEISSTSRTVGKWTKIFKYENSTFSLPLEPIFPQNTEYYCQQMNASNIKWMDPSLHTWIQHDNGEAGDNTTLEVGVGYEIHFPKVDTRYTFLGLPGSMIRYNFGSFLGFDYNIEAESLSANILSKDNVTLSWAQPLKMDSDDVYKIYRAQSRDGFFDGSARLQATIPYGTQSWTDFGVAQPGTQYYYMVIPENELGEEGASTYSIGVFTKDISGQYETIGIPLITDSFNSAFWYCGQSDDIVGINYYIHTDSRWGWHSSRMPQGAFDPVLIMMEGYQISTSGPTKLTFIGR